MFYNTFNIVNKTFNIFTKITMFIYNFLRLKSKSFNNVYKNVVITYKKPLIIYKYIVQFLLKSQHYL